MRDRKKAIVGGRKASKRAGLTLIEISISMALIATVLLASTASFSSSLMATGRAKRMTEAALFLETTMENLSAVNYSNLLPLNGNQVFSANDAGDSDFTINLTTFQAEVDLVQINAVVVDLQSGQTIGRVTTVRANR